MDWAVLGLCFYFANYLLRACRIKTLSKIRIAFWPHAVQAACLHGFASYMLPIRSGDLTLPLILRRFSNMPLIDGGNLLIKARLLDLSMLGFWLLLALGFASKSLPYAIIFWGYILGTGMLAFPFILAKIAKTRNRYSNRLFLRVTGLIAFDGCDWLAIIQSLAIWFAVGACFYCTVKAVGLGLSIGEVWVLVSIQLPLQLIPLQGFANAGNHEVGWVIALALFGISYSDSLKFAITSHALLMGYVIALGPFAILGLISNRQETTNLTKICGDKPKT